MVTIENGIGNYIISENILYSYFAGNNYLGLAAHPDLVTAATEALTKYGVSFSASRQTTGTSSIHLELEKLLAEYKNEEDAIVFATGYLGNHLLMETLKNQYSLIITDAQSHPSIRFAGPGRRRTVSYYHCDPNHLENLLKKETKRRALIATDGIFALTGEIAPIDEIYFLAQKYHAILIVDDAHATGVLGEKGRGTPEHFKIERGTNLYQSETMSKALGAFGGFITAEKNFIQKMRSTSTAYSASTALPPSLVGAGCASVRLINQHPELRQQLLENAFQVREGVKKIGFATSEGITPIIPLFFENQPEAKNLSAFLLLNHIIAPAVDYPVKTGKFIVRVTVSATHTKDQIENLLHVLKIWRDKHETNNH